MQKLFNYFKLLSTTSSSTDNNDLEVIVVGINKTGTSCLKSALEILYHGSTCFHYTDLLYQSNETIVKWLELQLCQYQTRMNGYHCSRQELLSILLKDYKSASGIPITPFLSDLIQMYPKVKVILTVRNAELWHAACRSQLLPYRTNESKLQQFLYRMSCLSSLDHLKLLSLQNTLGRTTNLRNDNELINAYSRWNDYVISSVPKERLLIYNIKQGWLPLCNFLGKPIPSCTFPGRNSMMLCNNVLKYTKKLLNCILYIFIYLFIFYYLINLFR